MKRLPLITPETVTRLITFEGKAFSRVYSKGAHDLFTVQAEGVTGIWNLLATQAVAILADEVGTGKTIQALSVLALLWTIRPKARVLVIAPNQSVAEHWMKEFTGFLENHLKVRGGSTARAIRAPTLCTNLEDVVQAFADDRSLFVITKLTIFSHLGKRGEDEDQGKKILRARLTAKEKRDQLLALIHRPLDLLVVDEAHHLRNIDGPSQRVAAFRAFAGPPGDPLADRALLLTATPNHTNDQGVGNLLSYFRFPESVTAKDLLKKYAIRRLRLLEGRNKYQYRHEQHLECTFGNDLRAELFFALYQKGLAEIPEDDGVKRYPAMKRRFLFGYLEGFESVQVVRDPKDIEDQLETRPKDYYHSADTELLRKLASKFNGAPSHPKYDQVMAELLPPPGMFWHANERLPEEDKCLVFVRRIPSSRELAKRGNDLYDRLFLDKILEVIGPGTTARKEILGSEFFRAALEQAIEGYLGPSFHDETPEAPDSETDFPQENQTSRIMEYFRRLKGTVMESTHGSRFRTRFTSAKDPFSLFFEPPHQPESPQLPSPGIQQDYRQWARRLRLAQLEVAAPEQFNLLRNHWHQYEGLPFESTGASEEGLPTLASIFHKHLREQDRAAWNDLCQRSASAQEAFFNIYLRKGLLLASGAIVELFSWFLAARRAQRDGGNPYLAFCACVDRNFSGSLTQRLVGQATASFLQVSEKVVGCFGDSKLLEHHWTELEGHAPCAFCSTEIHDRKRLIRSFNTPFFPNLLIATSVLQEGVDLHLHCRRVLHYGIAWTVGDNEQRVGRIDRLFGAVHRNIKRGVDDRLLITYPYLAGSFDQDQLSQFVEYKYRAESELDLGGVGYINRAINLDGANADWKDWLRQPERISGDLINEGPCPYRPMGEAHPIWKKFLPEHEDG